MFLQGHLSLRASRENNIAKTELFELDEDRVVLGGILQWYTLTQSREASNELRSGRNGN